LLLEQAMVQAPTLDKTSENQTARLIVISFFV